MEKFIRKLSRQLRSWWLGGVQGTDGGGKWRGWIMKRKRTFCFIFLLLLFLQSSTSPADESLSALSGTSKDPLVFICHPSWSVTLYRLVVIVPFRSFGEREIRQEFVSQTKFKFRNLLRLVNYSVLRVLAYSIRHKKSLLVLKWQQTDGLKTSCWQNRRRKQTHLWNWNFCFSVTIRNGNLFKSFKEPLLSISHFRGSFFYFLCWLVREWVMVGGPLARGSSSSPIHRQWNETVKLFHHCNRTPVEFVRSPVAEEE